MFAMIARVSSASARCNMLTVRVASCVGPRLKNRPVPSCWDATCYVICSRPSWNSRNIPNTFLLGTKVPGGLYENRWCSAMSINFHSIQESYLSVEHIVRLFQPYFWRRFCRLQTSHGFFVASRQTMGWLLLLLKLATSPSIYIQNTWSRCRGNTTRARGLVFDTKKISVFISFLYLVGALEHYSSIQLGISSSQLTINHIFQRGRYTTPKWRNHIFQRSWLNHQPGLRWFTYIHNIYIYIYTQYDNIWYMIYIYRFPRS